MKKQESGALPPELKGIFWSRDIRHLDIKNDRAYIINQVLAYGTLAHLRWLFRMYPLPTIKKTFSEQPAKIYSPAAFNFAKNILLELKRRLPPKRYVSSLPRTVR